MVRKKERNLFRHINQWVSYLVISPRQLLPQPVPPYLYPLSLHCCRATETCWEYLFYHVDVVEIGLFMQYTYWVDTLPWALQKVLWIGRWVMYICCDAQAGKGTGQCSRCYWGPTHGCLGPPELTHMQVQPGRAVELMFPRGHNELIGTGRMSSHSCCCDGSEISSTQFLRETSGGCP